MLEKLPESEVQQVYALLDLPIDELRAKAGKPLSPAPLSHSANCRHVCACPQPSCELCRSGLPRWTALLDLLTDTLGIKRRIFRISALFQCFITHHDMSLLCQGGYQKACRSSESACLLCVQAADGVHPSPA